MNNRFKFRIWDNDTKRFYTQESWHIENPFSQDEMYSSEIGWFFEGLNGISKQKRLVIQQFTGLLDKNGREIYEGDIIYYNDSSDDSRGEVKFENFQWLIKWQWGGYTESLGVWIDNKEIEIIGNIFENSELLS